MQNQSKAYFRHAALALASLVSLAAWAQPAAPQGRSGPPAEAIAACQDLKAGNECAFTAPRGKVTGSCWAPEGKPLACRPKDAPAGGRTKPSKPQ